MVKTLKKTIRRVIAWVSLAALVAVLTAMPLLARQNAEADGPVATVKSGTLQSRTISRTLSGGGVLSEEDAEEITIPAGVKLKSFLVRNGDAVSEGPDSNFSIWYGAGYIFGYCEKVKSFDREMTEEEKASTIAWETRQLEIMDWLTDDVDWITGEKHESIRRIV